MRRPDSVIEELLVVVRLLQRRARRGLVEAAVVEPRSIRIPGDLGELDPLKAIFEILAGLDVPHPPLRPVRTGLRDSVGKVAAVLAGRVPRQGNGSIGGPAVGIEKHRRGVLQIPHGIEHRLILKAVVLREEVSAPFVPRNAVALIVPELLQASPDRSPRGDRREELLGEPVLRIDPSPGLRRIRLLEPTIRILHPGSVIGVRVSAEPRRRIARNGRPWRARPSREPESIPGATAASSRPDHRMNPSLSFPIPCQAENTPSGRAWRVRRAGVEREGNQSGHGRRPRPDRRRRRGMPF